MDGINWVRSCKEGGQRDIDARECAYEVAPGAPEKEDRRVFGTAGCSVWLKAAADWLVPPHNNNDGSKTF